VEAQGASRSCTPARPCSTPATRSTGPAPRSKLCTPIETDLFGTTDMYCWWPGQAPDTYNNPDWNAGLHPGDEGLDEAQVVKPEW